MAFSVRIFFWTATVCLLVESGFGKIFTKCSLAKELVQDGVPRSQVHKWVCMAKAESNMDTSATNTNSNGSSDHGIFQINDYWNCDPRNGRKTKNGCRKNCSSFRDTDLSDDVVCIKQLIREHHNTFGFSYGYRKKCIGKSPAYLSGCSY